MLLFAQKDPSSVWVGISVMHSQASSIHVKCTKDKTSKRG